jgi:hypothetical protein
MHHRSMLKEPYWAHDPDVVDQNGYTGFSVGNDFNRELLPPGTDDPIFPDGAVGVRVDADFWQVGALPYEQFKDMPIEEIVGMFWPECTNPSFSPDTEEYLT